MPMVYRDIDSHMRINENLQCRSFCSQHIFFTMDSKIINGINSHCTCYFFSCYCANMYGKFINDTNTLMNWKGSGLAIFLKVTIGTSFFHIWQLHVINDLQNNGTDFWFATVMCNIDNSTVLCKTIHRMLYNVSIVLHIHSMAHIRVLCTKFLRFLFLTPSTMYTKSAEAVKWVSLYM